MSLLPTAFLPHLPRATNTLEPIDLGDILGHIAILRELYIPPIHGGFEVSRPAIDLDDDEEDENIAEDLHRRSRARERRFSAGLVETMDGLGLGLDVQAPQNGSISRREVGNSEIIKQVIDERPEEEIFDNEEDEGDSDEEDGIGSGHLDPFEREWAQKWLSGVVRRSQTFIEENDEEEDDEAVGAEKRAMEGILRDATAVLAMMAGTSAAGSLTRHLLFPVHSGFSAYLGASRKNMASNPDLSPSTNTFLRSLSASPASPLTIRNRLSPIINRRTSIYSNVSTSPTTSLGTSFSPTRNLKRRRRSRRQAIPILLHDAPMGDHLSVGVQTWGSAILLGRAMALNPEEFGLHPPINGARGPRVLELGAGTGLLSILCRKILDLQMLQAQDAEHPSYGTFGDGGIVVATDFLESVLSNLKICVDLNFPPDQVMDTTELNKSSQGIHIAKLDWTTFPAWAEKILSGHRSRGSEENEASSEESAVWVKEPFDLVLASDCVYDPTHAKMLREVARWVLRLPDPSVPGDEGGTFHILSPLRPTFAPELESIDIHFPTISSYPPLPMREAAATNIANGEKNVPPELLGEGLGIGRGLKLGVRGEGKKSVRGRKGEGRVDEGHGYWWWEVRWG